MAFSAKLSESFGKVIEQTPYTALDPIIKCNYVPKGKNIIFGRTSEPDKLSNLIYIGKVLETASGSNYLGADAWLDTSFPHVIYITGTRGSGKSFDLGVILEGISSLSEASPLQVDVTPVTSFLIDTQSQFWTLRYAPRAEVKENHDQIQQLDEWNLRPNALSNTKVFVPPSATKFLGDEEDLRIRPSDVLHEEWCALIGQEVYGPQGHILSRTLEHLAGSNYEIADMISFISDDRRWTGMADSSRNAVLYRLSDYQKTNLFSSDGLDLTELLVPGRCNIFMLRDLRNEDKSLVTAILARQLFTTMGRYHQTRRVSEFFGERNTGPTLPSRVWLLIDEAHVVAPNDVASPARAALVEYVKRGRDAGLSLVLATQQPSAVDDRILSQVNIAFSHRLAFQSDINAAVYRIPTKTLSGLRIGGTKLTDFGDMLRLLESGQCFLGDQSTSRTVIVQIRPRVTAHGGYSPL